MEKVRNVSTKICDDIPPCYSTNHAQLEMATKKHADLFDEGEFDVSIQFRETFVETINMQSKSLYRSRAGSRVVFFPSIKKKKKYFMQLFNSDPPMIFF